MNWLAINIPKGEAVASYHGDNFHQLHDNFEDAFLYFEELGSDTSIIEALSQYKQFGEAEMKLNTTLLGSIRTLRTECELCDQNPRRLKSNMCQSCADELHDQMTRLFQEAQP